MVSLHLWLYQTKNEHPCNSNVYQVLAIYLFSHFTFQRKVWKFTSIVLTIVSKHVMALPPNDVKAPSANHAVSQWTEALQNITLHLSVDTII